MLTGTQHAPSDRDHGGTAQLRPQARQPFAATSPSREATSAPALLLELLVYRGAIRGLLAPARPLSLASTSPGKDVPSIGCYR